MFKVQGHNSRTEESDGVGSPVVVVWIKINIRITFLHAHLENWRKMKYYEININQNAYLYRYVRQLQYNGVVFIFHGYKNSWTGHGIDPLKREKRRMKMEKRQRELDRDNFFPCAETAETRYHSNDTQRLLKTYKISGVTIVTDDH